MENNFFNLVPGGSNPELTDSYGLNLSQTANLLNNNETTPLISLLDTEINPLDFNEIPGTLGRDEITGTEGDDLITGSYGKDIITAGTGIDIFVYNSMRDAGDIITDFDPDQDLLDLNVVLGTLAYEGEDPVAEGYVIFEYDQDGANVLIDQDGLGAGRSRKYIELQFVTSGDNKAPNDIELDNDSVEENADGAIIGNISVSDPDTEPEFTNNIVTVSDNRFEVIDNNGTLQLKLKDGQSLNYEAGTSVTLNLTATDANDSSLTYSEEFTINVINVNEAPNDLTLDNNTVTENRQGAIIGNISVVDPDNVPEFTNNMVTVEDDRFEVIDNGGTLQLKLKDDQSLDFDLEETVTLLLTARDVNDNSLIYSEELTINVLEEDEEVNQPPNDIELDGDSVEENADGAVISNISVSDPNIEPEFTNNIVTVDDDHFEVVDNGGTLQLKLKAGQSLNYEAETTVDLNLIATDRTESSLTYSEEFTIDVINVNEAPNDLTLDNNTVTENQQGAIIGNVGVSDPDNVPEFTNNVVTVDDDRFEIIDNNGTLQLKLKDDQSLDFDVEPSVTLILTATDINDGSLTYSEEFTLNVINEDEPQPPSDIELDGDTIAENADGAVIGNVSVSDPDSGFGDNIVTVSDNRFEVVDNGGTLQLKLKAGQSLNYEAEQTVNLTLTATDANDSGLTYSEQFTINVINVNEAPDDLTLDNNSVEENQLGAVIGNVGVSDPDNVPEFTNNLVTVSDDRFEVVDNNGTLQLKLKDDRSLDFEAEPTVTLTLMATDINDGSLTYSEEFVINVIDVDEPVGTIRGRKFLDINDPIIGQELVINGDAETGDLTGWDSTGIEIISGAVAVAFGSAPDEFEVGDFAFTGGPGPANSQTLTQVIDISSLATEIDASQITSLFSVWMQSRPLDFVQTIVSFLNGSGEVIEEEIFVDPIDGTNTWDQYTDERVLPVNTRAIQITLDTSRNAGFRSDGMLDRVSLKLSNVGSSQNSGLAGVTIYLDLNNNAILDPDEPFQVTSEDDPNTPGVNETGQYEFTDVPVGNYVVREVIPSGFTQTAPSNGFYEVEVLEGEIIDNIDFGNVEEETPTNQAPNDLELDPNIVAENADGSIIGNISVSDPDTEPEFTNNIVTVSDNRFEVVDNGGTLQLKLKAGQSLNYEVEPTVDLTLTATDANNSLLTYSEQFTINVINVNEAPFDLTLDNNSVEENQLGAVVGNVGVSDPDNVPEFTNNVVTVSDDRFEVVDNGGTLQLKLKDDQSLDFEVELTVTVNLTATDAGDNSLTYSEEFIIDVLDVNEPPVITSEPVTEFIVGSFNESEVIDFETLPDGSPPSDNLQLGLNNFYTVDGVNVTFGFDTNNDGVVDTPSLFERIGNDVGFGFESTGRGRDLAAEGFEEQLGNFFLRPVSLGNFGTFIINYNSPIPVTIASGEIWDIDGAGSGNGEQFEVKAFDSAGNLLDTITSPFYATNSVLNSLDSQPWTFNFSGLSDIEEIHITFVGTKRSGIGLAFNNFFPLTSPTVYTYDVEAEDPDGDELIYSLTQSPDGMVIDPDTGLITWDTFEEELGDYNVTVLVEDGNGGTDTQTFTLTLTGETPENQAPDDLELDPNIVAENADGSIIGNISVSDPDTEPEFTNNIVTVSDNRFEVVDNGGTLQLKLKAGQSLNYEVEPTVDLTLTATDANNSLLTYSEQFTINVINVNEAPDDLTLDNNSVEENQLGAVIGNVGVSDPDNVPEFTNNVVTVEDDRFEVVDNGGTLQLKLKDDRSLDFELEPTVTVTLTATDAGDNSLTYSEPFVIDVLDEPFRDIDLTVDNLDLGGVEFDGQNLTLSGTASVEIINLGSDATTKSFEVLFFEDSNANQIYDNGIENFLGTTQVDNIIESGASLIIEAQISGSVNFLGSPIGAFVDAQNLIEEPNETNNVTTTSQDCDDQGNQPGQFNPVVEWNKSSFSVVPSSNQVMMTPAVIDLNSDSIPDIVFSTFTGRSYQSNGKLRAISGEDGSEIWTVTDSAYEVLPSGSIAVGDIDNDSLPEIVAPYEDGSSLIAFEHDGTFKWRSSSIKRYGGGLGGSVDWGGASLADLDHDGITEIIVGGSVLDNQGNILWEGSFGGGNIGLRGPLSGVADLDMDGSPEIVAGSSAYRADGSLYWNSSIADGFPAVGNFDDDDFPEIVVVSPGQVSLLEHTGEIKWTNNALPSSRYGPPTVADLDGDGELEIGIAGRSYTVLETDGSVKWTQSITDSSSMTGSSVFDFEGDGRVEVVSAAERSLRIYDGETGSILYQFNKSSATTYEYPLVVDVDADGNAEIITVANNSVVGGSTQGIFVIGDLNDTWVPTRQIWNQHTYHITNINDDGTIPAVEANNWEIYNNYRLNTLTEGNTNACPDLAMSFVRLEDNAGETTITARIGNGGTIFVNSGVNVAFYQGNPEQGGTLLGVTQTTTRLNPAEFEDISLTINESITLEEIWVVADDDGTGQGFVSESNEENNTYNYVADIPD